MTGKGKCDENDLEGRGGLEADRMWAALRLYPGFSFLYILHFGSNGFSPTRGHLATRPLGSVSDARSDVRL